MYGHINLNYLIFLIKKIVYKRVFSDSFSSILLGGAARMDAQSRTRNEGIGSDPEVRFELFNMFSEISERS